MSYARKGPGSDVYIYPTGGEIACQGCGLLDGTAREGDVHYELSAWRMLRHLQERDG